MSFLRKLVNVLLISIFISTSLYGQDFKPTLKTLDSSYIYGNDEEVKVLLLQKINQLEQKKNADPLLLSRHYNLLGELFHYASDIGKAYEYWLKSFNLIKGTYGLNSVYIAENYSLLARYYNFRIKIDSAFYFAEKSIAICNAHRDSLNYIPVQKIYKEYAYAGKIYWRERDDYITGSAKSRVYLDSAIYFNNRYFDKNIVFNAQCLQSIGNLYTDLVCAYLPKKDRKQILFNYTKANEYYDKAISIRKKIAGNEHEKIAMLYYVKGVVCRYAFLDDSLERNQGLYQQALRALIPGFNDTNILSVPQVPANFYNKAFATILLTNKIKLFAYQYEKTKDIKYIRAGYEHSMIAVELWESSLRTNSTFEIHQALNTYGASPFEAAIPITARYYTLAKGNDVKVNLARWIDLEKYSTIIKQNLENNKAHSIPSVDLTAIQKHLKADECFINQYYDGNDYVVYFVTSIKSGILPPVRSLTINTKIDSLRLSLSKSDAPNYCKNAKWLYDTLLKPVINELPENITHLLLSPHNGLAKLPFDALVLNDCNSYLKADFLINHYHISYALSANLLFNSESIETINDGVSLLAPTFFKHTALPFSSRIYNDLKSNYSVEKTDTVTSSANDILHLATHAYCNVYESRNSYILFSDKDSLFLHDLYKKHLNYKLAILSACETANGKYEDGEGIINFNRYLYLSGIKNTITTLWKVDDQSTNDILKQFYANVSNGETTGKALYDSKLEYIKNPRTTDDINPYYWAGVVYTGNDLILEKRRGTQYILYSFIGLGIVAGLYLLFRKLRL
jgi:CHAT domain-containing protein